MRMTIDAAHRCIIAVSRGQSFSARLTGFAPKRLCYGFPRIGKREEKVLPFIGGVGPLEWIIILVIVIIIFGVGRLPTVGGALGKSIREFREASQAGRHRG